jgi:anti-sigma28 factor (negative regulator of flagellin synthesis)
MADINPISQTHAPSYERTPQVQRTAPSSAVQREDDSVELSIAARMRSRLSAMPEVRHDLVAQVKAEIASGNYVTEDKIDALLDDLMSDLEAT